MINLNLQKVESSNIEAIGYHAGSKILAIKFLKSGIYLYWDVTPEQYAELMAAESHGKYFISNIKPTALYAGLPKEVEVVDEESLSQMVMAQFQAPKAKAVKAPKSTKKTTEETK